MNSWIYIILIAFILAISTTAIIHNTIPYGQISDADRYVQEIQNGTSRIGLYLLSPFMGKDFVTETNFLFIALIGYLVYSSTKNWKITILALLGFSVSLMLYFSLLAQAIVIIIGLFLWTKVETKGIVNHLIYLLAAILCFYTHKFGIVLVVLVYLIKRFNIEKLYVYFHRNVPLKTVVIAAYAIVGILFFWAFFNAPERVSFYYYFILPVSLGPLDLVFWYGLFGILLWMLLSCKDNHKEILVVVICLLGTVVNYIYFSHLQIDFWRILIFAELVMLIKIGQSEESKIIKWAPWFLIALGIERLILGIIH